jgi:hypothetical protein
MRDLVLCRESVWLAENARYWPIIYLFAGERIGGGGQCRRYRHRMYIYGSLAGIVVVAFCGLMI